jgi:glutathione S-transferase
VATLELAIGNKNYSSWSLRAWIMLRQLGLEFAERQLPLDTPQFRAEVRSLSPTGRVPVLRDGDLRIWDSLAICEYACELAGRGWPRERAARAVARSAVAEMHSGFQQLRQQWPMNARARRRTPMTEGLAADITRIDALWQDCRARFGSGGNWLFGEYSVADAMYAPVVLRFRTYGAQLSAVGAAYAATALADPILQSWTAAAAAEPWIIAGDETGIEA